MNARLLWLLARRPFLTKRLSGFRAHWTSVADSECVFSEHVSIGKRVRLTASTVGIGSYIAGDTNIYQTDIGAFCSVGSEVRIGAFFQHPTNLISTHPAFYAAKNVSSLAFRTADIVPTQATRTIIGSDVWIGNRAMIMDGVAVGHGAVIAAGALVTRNVEPYAIVAGVPAKKIRKRFGDDTITLLLSTQWWMKPLATIKEINPTNFQAHLANFTVGQSAGTHD